MDNSRHGLRNISSGPTEESLSSINTGVSIMESVKIIRSDPSFLCCIRLPNLASYFCGSSISLKSGLCVIGLIDFFIGICGLLKILLNLQSIQVITNELICNMIQAIGIINLILYILACRLISCSAFTLYYWKVLTLFTLTFLKFIIGFNADSLQYMVTTMLYCLIEISYNLFSAYILYCFSLLIRKGNRDLAKYGPDVIEAMENMKKQAAAMEMRISSFNGSDFDTMDTIDKKQETN